MLVIAACWSLFSPATSLQPNRPCLTTTFHMCLLLCRPPPFAIASHHHSTGQHHCRQTQKWAWRLYPPAASRWAGVCKTCSLACQPAGGAQHWAGGCTWQLDHTQAHQLANQSAAAPAVWWQVGTNWAGARSLVVGQAGQPLSSSCVLQRSSCRRVCWYCQWH